MAASASVTLKNGGDGGDDDDEGKGREIALRLFVSFGEEGDGHEERGKEDGEREGHEEHSDN